MAIWLNKETRLVVQGITGKEGKFHALGCRDYGTQVVAGVTPGKGGETVEGIPVFDSVEEARQATGANASMIFVPPPFAADAIMEAADAGIELVVGDHRGHPGQRHAPRQGVPAGDKPQDPPDRPELPRHHHARARRRSASCRATSTARAASASSRAPARSPTRRSGSSPASGSASRPASASAAIRSTARTSSTSCRRSATTRRPRRVILIGEIGGSAEEEAAAWIKAELRPPGGRLHRRPHGAAGTPHGPCRRDRRRRQGHRRRQDGGDDAPPASTSASRRPTSARRWRGRSGSPDRR